MRELEDFYLDDYLLKRAAENAEEVERIKLQAASLTTGGAITGQIAVWDGSAFVPAVLVGDTNGISVVVIGSPFGLRVAQSQDLKNTASPTFAALTISGLADVSQLKVGGNETIKEIDRGTVAVDPGSIGATSTGTVDVTITGLAAGDFVMLMRPDGLHDDLIVSGHRVQAADTLRIYLYNPTGGAIDDGSLTWEYLWFDLT
jgi:hypothetical protein